MLIAEQAEGEAGSKVPVAGFLAGGGPLLAPVSR